MVHTYMYAQTHTHSLLELFMGEWEGETIARHVNRIPDNTLYIQLEMEYSISAQIDHFIYRYIHGRDGLVQHKAKGVRIIIHKANFAPRQARHVNRYIHVYNVASHIHACSYNK